MRTKPRIAWARPARIQTVSRHKLRFPSDRDPVGGNGAACVRDELDENGPDQFSQEVAPCQGLILGSEGIKTQQRLQISLI